MTEQQNPEQEGEGTAPFSSPIEKKENLFTPLSFLPISIVLGSLIVAASIIFGAYIIGSSLSLGFRLNSLQSGTTQSTADAPSAGLAVTVTPRANEPTLGNKNAKVTVVEFGDFQCPFCKEFYQQTFSQIKKQYIDTGKIQYVFRNFPLTQLHVNAQIAAVAAECANVQGKFWDYHNLLYANGQADGTNLDKTSLEKYGSSLGLNSGTLGFGKNKFNQCLESNATLPVVNADQAEGTKDGISGTPSFFINGQIIVGAQGFSTFQQAIDAALNK